MPEVETSIPETTVKSFLRTPETADRSFLRTPETADKSFLRTPETAVMRLFNTPEYITHSSSVIYNESKSGISSKVNGLKFGYAGEHGGVHPLAGPAKTNPASCCLNNIY